MSDDRAPVYQEGSTVVYRASSVGLCERALIGLRMGFEAKSPPSWFQEKLNEGTQAEAELVDTVLRKKQAHLASTQDEVEIVVSPGIVIRGHTDGRGRLESGDWGLEVKKLGPSLYANWKRGLDAFWASSPYYRDQLTIYMEATGLRFWYGVGEWDPDEKRIVSVDVRIVNDPPSDIETIKAKVLRVEAMARTGNLPTECSARSWPCPIFYTHEEDDERVELDTGDEAMSRIEALARTIRDATDREKMAKSAKDYARSELVDLLTEIGHIKEVEEGEYQFVKSEAAGLYVTPYVHTSTYLDRRSLVEAGIDLDDHMKQSKKLTVKVMERREKGDE